MMLPLEAGNELTKTLLGSGALTVILVALAQAGVKIYENRTSLRGVKIAASREEEVEDSRYLAAFRANAEVHLFYDVMMQRDNLELRAEVNRLEREHGRPPREFPPLPTAPPLFPKVPPPP